MDLLAAAYRRQGLHQKAETLYLQMLRDAANIAGVAIRDMSA